jgi:hypothetical protein
MSATINRQGCVGLRPPELVNIVMSTSTRFCPKSADTTALNAGIKYSSTVTNMVRAPEKFSYATTHNEPLLPKNGAQDFQWLSHGSQGERIKIESWL